jgi:hypothetical protein
MKESQVDDHVEFVRKSFGDACKKAFGLDITKLRPAGDFIPNSLLRGREGAAGHLFGNDKERHISLSKINDQPGSSLMLNLVQDVLKAAPR